MHLLKYVNRAPVEDGLTVEERLKGLEIFSKLNDKQIRALARHFVARRYTKGEVFIKKGDTGLGMFVIVTGLLEVYDQRDGSRATLATLRPGQSVGEMSLLDSRPRSANVEAIEDTDCLLITRDSFNGLTRRDPEVLWGIVPQLAERLRVANERLARLDDRLPPEAAAGPVAEARSETPADAVAERLPVPADAPARPVADHRRVDDDDVDEDGVDGSSDQQSAISGLVQLSSASLMFWSSAWVLGAQESLRVFKGRDSVGRSLSESEKVVSSLTSKYEEQMNDQSKQMFRAMQELVSAAASILQR